MPMALSSDFFLVPQARIRGFKRANFTNRCKIVSDKCGRMPFSRTFSAFVVVTVLLQQDQRVWTKGPRPTGYFGTIFFSWCDILWFYFACSRFLCARQHSTYSLKSICSWVL